MAKTTFSNGTVVTSEFLNKIFVTNGGHVHDGGSDDGSAPKVSLASHVTGILPMSMYEQDINGFIQGVSVSIETAGAPSYNAVISSGRMNASDDSVMFSISNIAKRIDATWVAGTNQGGRASGVSLAPGEYSVFAIYNPTTGAVDAGFDTSETAANLLAGASGFTKYRKIGSIGYAGPTYKNASACYICGISGNEWAGVARGVTEESYASENDRVFIDIWRRDDVVTLLFPLLEATSDSTYLKVTSLAPSWPLCILPELTRYLPIICADGSVLSPRPGIVETPYVGVTNPETFIFSCMAYGTGGVHAFSDSGWANTGTKKLFPSCVTYPIYNNIY